MQEDIAKLVHPVLTQGLRLQRRLAAGESPDLDVEQTLLKDLLLSDMESRRIPVYGGESFYDRPEMGERQPSVAGHDFTPRFLGVRYALACWLDELFTADPQWGPRWNERKLEMELYGSNDRAWKFWEQARMSPPRPGNDALEVYYLCVTLGFRGELRSQPERLQSWLASTRLRLGKVQEIEWPYRPELAPSLHVPPLRGRERMRQMILTGWVTLLFLVPVVAFFIVRQFGR